MPIYEYRCKNKHRTEKRLVITESDKPVKCDTCGEQTEKQISLTSPPIFNGDGWTPKFGR